MRTSELKLNENNISIVLQSARERLMTIDNSIKEKESKLESINASIEKNKEEEISLNQSIDKLTKDKEKLEKDLKDKKEEFIETSKTITEDINKSIFKLEEIYTKIVEAKENQLKTIEESIIYSENHSFDIIDNIQNKKREEQTLDRDLSELNSKIEIATKQMFSLQNKFDDLREKEQFIKKKYEDAGIPYVN